ncbi:hypothetical protein KOM00_19450 [Geomonas sp. Red69]|uniref:SUEL-type lectin domain-containing protein n=1 Tax=Geomonas diazotrophica TaxID=2843197 RepID=A0ABX8JEG7_9BACT|nr:MULTISPECIES: hypothetical protein [Geomonas]MBU5638901.1 hypothetical protein [Geomonas diazotrophica]QWV96381.1 hypothetical protein KP005_13490 [Geomonas nitrogeniifigens]QXE85448.1 hypothetical protein KP003_13775 [Geomonas nitrogeniifigens]
MEYFVCRCRGIGEVFVDGVSQGTNKDADGKVSVKLCNPGLHIISLRCQNGGNCVPKTVEVNICDTDPICPKEVHFRCS